MTSNSEAPKQDMPPPGGYRKFNFARTFPKVALESWSVSSPAARATERSKRTYTRSTTKRRSSRTWTSITPWSRDLWCGQCNSDAHNTSIETANSPHAQFVSKFWNRKQNFSGVISPSPSKHLRPILICPLAAPAERSSFRRSRKVQGVSKDRGSQDGFFPLLPRLADPRCRRRPLAPLFAVRDQTIVIQEPGYVLGLHRRLFDERLEYCSMPLYGLRSAMYNNSRHLGLLHIHGIPASGLRLQLEIVGGEAKRLQEHGTCSRDFTDRNPQVKNPQLLEFSPRAHSPFRNSLFLCVTVRGNMDIILSSEDKIAPPTPKRNLLRVEEQNFGPALFREQFRLTQTQTEVTRALRDHGLISKN
ncbi:hypothetical protein L596_027244 [Steinernema carpocapsae]|uniref:Uncharacterized protein n=1 Tax=Steinernema carpocapsae TaxID=34508 RepID=A0A4U5M3T0_STECR|nr:hypothetical protein L596_027244 [Steinernema carpocapsae]